MAARLAAVIGSPVTHSLSPAIHRAAFAAAGVDWSYVAFDVADGEAEAALDAMRTLGIAGLSVTMPHKTVVSQLVDRLDAAALRLKSVNTVSRDGAALVGSSTDGAGFVASLDEAGVDVDGAKVAIIGAGVAARSLVDALARAGSIDIVILNRTPANAADAVALTPVASLGALSDIGRADIVVNATSIGMGENGGFPCDPSLFRETQVVADLVYHPLETQWLTAAAERGCRTVDGLGMLVHQAALQQQIWLGDEAVIDTAAMRAAAEAVLALPA